MKKLILSTLCVFLTIMSYFCQVDKDSVYLVEWKDVMEGKTYVMPSRKFAVQNENSTVGFVVNAATHSDFTLSTLMVRMFNIGVCNENDEIIILFENGERITKKSWREFNCKGETYFSINDSDMKLLRTQPLSKIRMTNGVSFESFTGDVEVKDKRYFIQLLYSLDNKLTTIK